MIALKNCSRYEEDAGEILFYVEIVIMTQFSIEYVLRIWSAGCRGRYEGIRGFGFHTATAARNFKPEVRTGSVETKS